MIGYLVTFVCVCVCVVFTLKVAVASPELGWDCASGEE